MKRSPFSSHIIPLILLTLLIALNAAPALGQSWTFGVMSDTQWTVPDDGKNPNSVAVGIINQVNQQFIKANVKFVIQVGDLTDNGSSIALDARAQAAQALYNAGIGFYPLRGNHETSQAAAVEFRKLFPQTRHAGPNLAGAKWFSSPTPGLSGLSYAFTYNNARFVLLDQFVRLDGSGSGSNATNNTNIADQFDWINRTVRIKANTSHAFVFGHKNLIGQNHVDFLLGSDPSQNPILQNAFLGILQSAGVRYYIGGHDHVHQRSQIVSPDGLSKVQQLIGASDSSKFYIPALPSNDEQYDTPRRETSIAQERNRIGYYIFTVDGPQVTVDYYSAESDPTLVDGEYLMYSTPKFHFAKRETYGYSLNGKEFLVAEGSPYTSLQDSYQGTTARILTGTNSSFLTDGSLRPLTKAIDTGWTIGSEDMASNVLRLWGMTDLGNRYADTYALSLSYNPKKAGNIDLTNGKFAIVTQDKKGNWVNAVKLNSGGTPTFVLGPWDASYDLGTYGIDPASRTAWAVIDYTGNFAVANFGTK